MTTVTLCMIGIIWLLVWVLILEIRLNLYKKSLIQILDVTIKHGEMMKENNDASESQKLKSQAIINAVNNHDNDITHMIKAINYLSQEVTNDDILTKNKKPTIQ